MPDQQKYTNKLQNTHILIIGGSSGLGYTAAEACIEHGAYVTISSSNPTRISTAISKLQAAYPSVSSRISGHACDLGSEDLLESNITSLLSAATNNNTLKLDHVVYTAGDPLAMMSLADASIAKIKQAGCVRFFGPLMVGKLAPAYMNTSSRSSITLTTGSVSQKPNPGWTIVGAFATGLHGMMRGLALDLKPLRVNLISPGAVDTELWAGLGEEAKQGMFKAIAGKLPTGRVGKAEDVAEAYLYVMKDGNVTGSVVSTNGGHLLV